MSACLRWPLRRGWVVLLPLFAGCFSGFNSNVPVQQTYVLRLQPEQNTSSSTNSAAGTSAAAAGGARPDSLEVQLPVAATGLSGDGIAVLRAGERLDYYSGGRWAVPAPLLLQRLVIETLRRGGRFSLVESDTGPFEATDFLSVEMEHFEADYAGGEVPTVRVELICTLGRRMGRGVLTSFTASSAVQADADRMQSVISAFEQATNQALTQLAEHIQPPTDQAARSP
jgi:cholesterol transport system auxiliary component